MKRSFKILAIIMSIGLFFTVQGLYAQTAPTKQGVNPGPGPLYPDKNKPAYGTETGQQGSQGVQDTSAIQEGQPLMRSSNFIGKEVVGRDNEELGSVADILMDSNGQVHYFVIDRGGLLGGDQNMVPIPWNQVRTPQAEGQNQDQIAVNLTKSDIDQAPGFAENDIQNFNQQEVRGYYQDKGMKQ